MEFILPCAEKKICLIIKHFYPLEFAFVLFSFKNLRDMDCILSLGLIL